MRAPDSRSGCWAAVLAFLLCLSLTALRSNPPAPQPAESNDRFSAILAGELLESIYHDRVTHPIGTDNNRLYKQRILDHLRGIGYEPIVQREFVCRETLSCGHVENILARLEGTEPGKAVLLAVHYDSVGAGPSVSDDGVAVAATLEIARMMKAGPQPRNDVIFLIDDGEEAGLLGAIAFSARHPWAGDVGAVVNLESRGSGGQSFMFETGTDNAWLVELMDRHLPRPSSTSLFYSIYQRLPNDTDFTIFKHSGMNGVNFAFVRNLPHYHTPLDDLDHYSPATLQHQGDNALGMVRALADAELDSPPTGTASWFDVWGFDVVSWPEGWNLPLAILSLALVALATVAHLVRGDIPARELAWGQLVFPLAVGGSTALALALGWFLTTVGKLPAWPTSAWAPKAAFWFVGLATPALVIAWVGRRTEGAAAWLGALEWLGLLGLVCAILLPGATYIFLAPAIVGGLLALSTSLSSDPRLRQAAHFLTVLAAGMTQLVLVWNLWEGMGITIMPFVTLLIAAGFSLVLIPCARAFDRFLASVATIGLVLASVLAVVAILLPAYCAESPRPLNFYFVQDADQGKAKLTLRPGRRPVPDAIAEAAEWGTEPERLYPWLDDPPRFLAADAEPLPLPGPRLEVLEEVPTPSGRRVVARLLSPRGGDRAALVIHDPARIAAIELDGWPIELHGWTFDLKTQPEPGRQAERRRVLRSATIPAAGIEIRVEIEGPDPLRLSLLDYQYGLPRTARSLVEARPKNIVPINRGDETVFYSKATL